MRVLRALFNFAIQNYDNELGQPLFTDNPVNRISHTRAWFNVERRRNVIQTDQLARWYNSTQNLTNTTARDYLLLLLFTGLRREEGAQLKWADVNFELKTLTIRDTKNHEPHCLPLTDFLVELLSNRSRESVYVFPSERSKAGYIINVYKPVEQVRKQSDIEFTLHDLRRSFITIAESLDISAYAVKRLVNHKMAQDVTAGYIIHDVERLRKPMQQITDSIVRAAGVKKTADIILLKNIN